MARRPTASVSDERIAMILSQPAHPYTEYSLRRVRELVGGGPTDEELMRLIIREDGCVSTAAEAYWDLQEGGTGNLSEDDDLDDDDDDDDDDKESSEEFEETLQMRVDDALNGRPRRVGDAPLNALAVELADAGETAALVCVWDVLGGSEGALPATWAAVERLHAKGKGRIPSGTLEIPEDSNPSLAPARRLHKICKGRQMGERSRTAAGHVERGLAWVAAQRTSGRSFDRDGGKARSALAKELMAVLSIDLETARGLLTTLKRKRAFA